MLRTALHVVPVLVAFGAAGCSTQSVSERSAACQVGDWRAYGATDGRLGVPEADRAEFFADCRKLGLTVDEAAYRSGRAEGLMYYCTAESGYQVGREGRPYHQVCTGQGDVAFRQGFERGREERPAARGGIYPSIGLGLGIGSRRSWGGVGIGVPLYYRDRHGFPYRYGSNYDACWSGPFPCRRYDYW